MRADPWQRLCPVDQAEESDLKRRHHQGETVEAIAAAFGRKPGAIRSRLQETRADLSAEAEFLPLPGGERLSQSVWPPLSPPGRGLG